MRLLINVQKILPPLNDKPKVEHHLLNLTCCASIISDGKPILVCCGGNFCAKNMANSEEPHHKVHQISI